MNVFLEQVSASKTTKDKYLFIVFVIYLVLLAIAVSHHEPWMDEAQAWLLVKDVGFTELFLHYLRYEGSPGLWHIIIMLPAKLGLPYYTINILSAGISAWGVWLFLRYAPFPFLIKILYPFSFFVFFQYGVIARSYCLIAPFLFLLAIHYPKKREQPYLFAALLCVLANISVHTFLIAGSIAFLHFIDVMKEWKSLDNRQKKHQLISLFIFGLVACVVVYIVLTPPDQTFAGYANWELINFIDINTYMIGGSLTMNEFNQLPWIYGTLSFVAFIVSVFWFANSKFIGVYLLPLLLLSALFAIKYRSPWHQGVLFLLWFFVLWISFEKNQKAACTFLSQLMVGMVTTVLAVQVYWCADTVSYDFFHNYSGSHSLAKYLSARQLQKEKIFVSGWRTVSVLPYFDHNIFYNFNNGSNHRFWNWSVKNETPTGVRSGMIDTIIIEKPELVIFASDHIASQTKIYIPGYTPAAFFTGYLCWKTGLIEPECYLVFRKIKPAKNKDK